MLTEREIFDCMRQNLRQAAAECDFIARQPTSGAPFTRLRECLKLAEGCCRQAGHWRQDGRWFQPGIQLEHIHQVARSWLHRPTVESKKLFTMLAEVLRKWDADLHRLQTRPTLRSGEILPKPQRVLRANRPVQVPAGFGATAGGILVPVS